MEYRLHLQFWYAHVATGLEIITSMKILQSTGFQSDPCFSLFLFFTNDQSSELHHRCSSTYDSKPTATTTTSLRPQIHKSNYSFGPNKPQYSTLRSIHCLEVCCVSHGYKSIIDGAGCGDWIRGWGRIIFAAPRIIMKKGSLCVYMWERKMCTRSRNKDFSLFNNYIKFEGIIVKNLLNLRV